MTRASVSELKAKLSRYLREVRRGGEVEVLDRGVPVARLTGIPADPNRVDADRHERLVRAGILRRGRTRGAAALEKPPLTLSTSILEALAKDRADRV